MIVASHWFYLEEYTCVIVELPASTYITSLGVGHKTQSINLYHISQITSQVEHTRGTSVPDC